MIKATLPNFFNHKTVEKLVRVGKANHGGFVIAEKDIENSDLLISLGFTEEWSFESDFLARNKVPVLACGTAVGKRYLFCQLMKSLVRFDRPKLAWYWLRTYYAYEKFFNGSNLHIEKLVGQKFSEHYCTIQEVFDKVTSNKIYLKIDIEGNEYRILDGLIANQHRITGMVIEFHDCASHLEKIQQFIQDFSLSMIHIHANNYAPLSGVNGTPLVLNISFSATEKANLDCKYPNPIDMPNNPNAEEIMLTFVA